MLNVYKKIRLSRFDLLKACCFSILIWGCSHSKESSIPSITIPRDTSGELLLRDLAKSVRTIPLETNEHALLHNVADVELFDGQLFVGDYYRVLIFDMHGNFRGSLGSRGQGPGEYWRNNSFTLDPATGTMYLATDTRILVYTADLKLSMEKKLGASTYYLDFTDGHLYMDLQSHGNIVELN